jgi:tetratricopeptide (TPR) repeat protein
MMLAQAVEFDPSRPWADAAWVGAAPVDRLDPDTLLRIFIVISRSLNEPVSDELRRTNQVWAELTRHSVAAHPDHAVLHGVCSAVVRRIGDPEQAVEWGRRGVELEPNKLTYVWYAYALRTVGRLEEAIEVMHTARRQYPLDIDLSADVASWLADSGRLDEAITIIEEALRVDPTYDCGVHTMHRLRFRRDRDAATHLVALSDFVRTADHLESHEHTDLADCCQDIAWLGRPAWASESTINAFRSVPVDKRSGGGTMHVTQMEVPSALHTLERAWPGLSISFADPTPDLVTPLREGPALWRVDGGRLVPALPPPLEPAAALLARTATPVWPHPVAAYDQALPLGELPAAQLLALLVHPPARPERYPIDAEDMWVRCAQAFACLGLLHCSELDAGNTSQARGLLTALAFGIEDWTTEAALFGLAVAAWVDPTCRAEVARTVDERYAVAQAATHVVTILPGLSELLLIVPGIDESTRSSARGALADAERVD